MSRSWQPRLATENDIPAIEALIPLSVRGLQAAHYSPAQMDAALGPIFGVDRQLIADRTYFAVDNDSSLVGCGGWSRRRAMFGGDAHRSAGNPELNPKTDPARIRAFFVHPQFARQGIARAIMIACEKAILDAGFRRGEISATLAGEPLYVAFGYAVVERYHIPLRDGLQLPVVRLTKTFPS